MWKVYSFFVHTSIQTNKEKKKIIMVKQTKKKKTKCINLNKTKQNNAITYSFRM